MRARVVGLRVSRCLLSFTRAHAQDLPGAKPEEVGFSSERLNRAMATVKAAVEKGNGAAGTTFSVDPKEDMFVVFMIQDPTQGRDYRALLKDKIYAAVDKPVAK